MVIPHRHTTGSFRLAVAVGLSCWFGFTTLFGYVAAQTNPSPGLRHISRVVLDPGHGGTNTGCMGLHGVFEKYLTLQIANRTAVLLKEKTGLEPILTRQDDSFVGLRERTQIAVQHQADVFISIHLNASLKADSQGVEVYFLSLDSATEEIATLVKRENWEPPLGVESDEVHRHELDTLLYSKKLDAAHRLSELFAASLYDALLTTTGFLGRGVKQAPFAVLKGAVFPAVVVECGFLTHEQEGFELLESERIDQIAKGIVEGIIAFDTRVAPPITPPTVVSKPKKTHN